MSTLETLRSLQKRVRESKGDDRELDCAIADTFNPHWAWPQLVKHSSTFCYTSDPDGLGACVALMGRALPGWRWSRCLYGSFGMLEPSAHTMDGSSVFSKPLANDCLTFIDAIIEAKIAIIAEEEARAFLTDAKGE